ncbi:tetratricopeptide repeat protein, partial [Endozoicomonas sp.]|uniref:tetratricopeptide repeat protein n=1 Tax=Endozoicomonas sp. TaxID=1892382 RepID=UPI00383B2E95
EDERFSASLESAGAGLSTTLRERIEKFQAPLTEEEAQLEELINQGLVLLYDKKTKTDVDESVAACELWLDAWELIKELYQDKTSLDDMDNKMGFTLDMWGSEIDMHLLNAARTESSFIEKGITFFREFLEHFPESSEDTHKAYRRASAELQFLMGECEQGDATFEALVKDYPDSTWNYIGWGDIYNPTFSRAHPDDVIADTDRAKKLYQIPIDRELEDADHASDRLDELLAYERKEATTFEV